MVCCNNGYFQTRKRKLEQGQGMDILLQQVETVYRAAVSTLQPQSIILTGRSGSGKTCNFKKALGYLVDTTQPSAESVFTGENQNDYNSCQLCF